MDQATLANEIARSMLKKDKGLQLSTEDSERNFKIAKEAALASVPARKPALASKKKLKQGVRITLTQRKECGTATLQEDDIIVGNDSSNRAKALSQSLPMQSLQGLKPIQLQKEMMPRKQLQR